MEFGKVETAELSKIDFDLPDDPVSNTEVLSSGKGQTKFYLGCASTKEKLNVYARTANCIELNATYYNLPAKKQIELWKIAVPDGFKYMPKFPQVITHLKRLKGTEKDTGEFLSALGGLESRLGPFFLMPHPQMDSNSLGVIQEFISVFPKSKSLFLELRHPGWFTEGYNTDMLSVLKKESRGTVISDSAGRRDAVHMHLSTPECFIRFVGNGLHHTDYLRIDQWIDRLKIWKEKGLETCYFFIHQQENKDASALLSYLKRKTIEMPEIIYTTIETSKGEVDLMIDKMPIPDEHFYAVYCYFDGKYKCFHLMYDTDSLEFKLVDSRNCPEELQEYVYLISRAIEHYHA